MTKENFFSSKPKQISEAAIIITERIFGNLENLTFCSIGSDEVIDSISELFVKNKLKTINILKKEIENFDIKFNKKKMEILSKTDILIMSLDRKENLIHKNEIIKSLLERKQKPLFLINASIPGNIDMDVNNIDNCFLFDLNDLEQFFSDRVHDIKKKNTTVLEAENDIEYFITKFSRVYNLNFDQKYKLESQIKSYFYKIEGLEEKKFLQNFINYLTQK